MTNLAPLTADEKDLILEAGWRFIGEDYIYIPNDYDGCMASGLKGIRRVLEGIERRNTREITDRLPGAGKD